MAASMNWCQKLNNHKLFDKLRGETESKRADRQTKDLIKLYDNEIFIYNQRECALLTSSLQAIARDSPNALERYQVLLPSCPPVHDVHSIQFNLTGTSLALIGPRGVSVVTLPQRWGKGAQYEGGKEKVICRTVAVGERLFVSDIKLKVQHALWHPSSKTDSHLAILTSDNQLRIFNVSQPEAAEQVLDLRDRASQQELSSQQSTLNITTALGETAVAFDFGPSVPLVRKASRGAKGDMAPSQHEKAWPTFVLKGNGDICVIFTHTEFPSPLQSVVSSPLVMYPPAEDNYGTDACSLLCVPASLPVLVVSTCAGTLHHCAVLQKDAAEQAQEEYGTEFSKQFEALPRYSLYVYESVELELALTSPSDQDDDTAMEYNCPVQLHRDPLVQERFHCSHDAGVHTVMLPWLHKFKQFCEEDDSDLLLQGGMDEQAVVEHLVCTRPTVASPPAPILGLTVTTDRLLGLALIVLTNSYQCINLPLRYTYQPPPAPLLSASPGKRAVSPLRKLHKQPFDTHIKQILQRSTSNPLLKGEGDLSQQELLQILGRATQVFRQEYMQKFETAHQEIMRRIAVLQQQKQQQQVDLEEALEARTGLRGDAEALAEKYEEAYDKQREILNRLEKVMTAIEKRVPVMSDAERGMQKELKEIKEQLQQMKINLQQVKQKEEYQSRVTSQQHQRSSTSSPGPGRQSTSSPGLGSRQSTSSPGLGKTQMSNIKNMLKREGDEISELVQKVKDLQMSVDT